MAARQEIVRSWMAPMPAWRGLYLLQRGSAAKPLQDLPGIFSRPIAEREFEQESV